MQQAAGDPATALWRDLADRPYLEIEAAVAAEHTLRVLAWQKTEDGRAGKNPPKPLTAPQDAAKPRRIDAYLAAKLAAFEARTRDQAKEA